MLEARLGRVRYVVKGLDESGHRVRIESSIYAHIQGILILLREAMVRRGPGNISTW